MARCDLVSTVMRERWYGMQLPCGKTAMDTCLLLFLYDLDIQPVFDPFHNFPLRDA
jgi:hypothetical protein